MVEDIYHKIQLKMALLLDYIKENKKVSVVVGIIVFILLWYFIFIFNRVNRSIRHLKDYRNEMSVTPLKFNRRVMRRNYRLCDFI